MYMLVAGGDLLQREAVKRMKWFEFYEVMRRQQEIKDKERESAQARTHKKTRTRHG